MQIFPSHFLKTGLQHPKNRQPRRQNNNNIQSVSDRSASPRLIAYICLNFSSAFFFLFFSSRNYISISTSNDRRMPARFFAAILGTASFPDPIRTIISVHTPFGHAPWATPPPVLLPRRPNAFKFHFRGTN
uniref:(northern house mosquito) hypothetical protein n=1 Tax=Culex pipiens TaxID=7175 RepID=A0A8D8CVI7_CULPI